MYIKISNRNNLGTLNLDSEKDSFYERIETTLLDNLSLLTIENLNAFADKLDKEKQKESFDLVDSLNESIDDLESKADLDSLSSYNSVDLSYTLPTDNNIDLTSWDSHSSQLNSFNFNYKDDRDQINDNDELVDEAQDTLTILSKYVDSLNVENKTELNMLMRNLYNEALTVESI